MEQQNIYLKAELKDEVSKLLIFHFIILYFN